MATFTEKHATSYTLNSDGVLHIKEGHGLNDRTIPCIARVLAEYDSREPSTTDRRYDVFRLQAEISHRFGNYINAKVVMERTIRFVITAYVETYALDNLPAYEGDP